MNGLTNDDALAGGAAKGIGVQTKTATGIVHDTDGNSKAYRTLQAQLARRGYSLTELATRNYLISRSDLTLHFSDLASVRQFYARIGGAQ